MSSASSNLVRRVYIDDTNPDITYRGRWSEIEGEFRENQEFGSVYKGSQHRLQSGDGLLTFQFKGTGSLAIFGTSAPINNSGVYDPSYTCTLDGEGVVPEKPLGLAVNLWPLCATNATFAGDHEFRLSARADEGTFYIDQITYTPDRDSPPEGPNTVGINQDDLAVKWLEGSWIGETGGMGTKEPGAKMSITFRGSSATFIGSIPKDKPLRNSTATYSLDGGPRVTFDVPGLNDNLIPRFGQPFFEVENLGPGTHELVVAYNGPNAPLVFDYLQVEGGDIMQSALTREVGGDTDTGGGKKKPIGAIVGGVVGGVVFLVALAVLAVLLMKRKKKKDADAAAAAVVHSRPPTQPHSPLSSTYEVKPLMMANQSPPSSFQTMPSTVTGDSMLQGHTMQPLTYTGQPPNRSSVSYPSGYPYNPPPVNQPQHQHISPLAPANMSVSYGQQAPTYPRPPEPML